MSYPLMSYAAAHALEPEAAQYGVSSVARGAGGFMRIYGSAGSAAGLRARKFSANQTWLDRRNNFVKRHLAQYRSNPTYRRWLALAMWAYRAGPRPQKGQKKSQKETPNTTERPRRGRGQLVGELPRANIRPASPAGGLSAVTKIGMLAGAAVVLHWAFDHLGAHTVTNVVGKPIDEAIREGHTKATQFSPADAVDSQLSNDQFHRATDYIDSHHHRGVLNLLDPQFDYYALQALGHTNHGLHALQQGSVSLQQAQEAAA